MEGVPPPYPGPQGYSQDPRPLCTVKSQKCSPRSSPRVGQAPSPLSSQAGRGGRPSAMAQVRGDGPQVAPTPQPACRCPCATPSVPAPAPHADSPAVAGRRVEQKGDRERSEKEGQPLLPSPKPPPALGRRPAGPLSVPLEGVGCRPFSKAFWSFLSPPPPPTFPTTPSLVATSLWISAVTSLLFISGWGIHCLGLLLLQLGTPPPVKQLGNNLVTHHRK